MKRVLQPIFILLLSFVYSNNAHATVFSAIANGDWQDGTTWDQGIAPGALDSVVIDGYTVSINILTGDVTVKNISLTNSSNIAISELKIDGLVTVAVTDDLVATSENINQDIDVQILNGAILNVQGNVDFTRSVANSFNKKLLLIILDASRMNVSGSFTFDYKNANSGENADEIFLDQTAILDVTGNTTLNIRGGGDFDFKIQGSSQAILRGNLDAQISGGNKLTITSKATSHFQVTGDVSLINSGATTHAMLHADGSTGTFTIGGSLTMNSTVADKIVYMEATNSACAINIGGDISMSALSEADVYIDLKASSNMFIGGDFLRPTNYGALIMAAGSTLIYKGTSPQVLADSDLAGSGTDAFNVTNVVLNNSTGFTLEDTMFVETNLILTAGKITTTSTEMIIIGDQATITGGSATAYIDGPLIKIGRSNNNPFLFPIGDATSYAPMGVSKIITSSSQYIAQYFGDPPPFGTSLAADVDNISGNQYWELSKTAGSDDVDITLHWMDADAKGVNDMDSLIVVGLNGSNVWESYGNGGTTGSTGVGAPGSVSSIDGDPPPFGVEKFTLGSVSELNALPVELTYFEANQREDEVNLKWQTASEINTSHFVLEHSNDGYNFEGKETIFSKGEPNFIQDYKTTDATPFKGLNYYRLKMVDRDGWYEYSQIEVVNFQNSQALSIYPNPVNKVLYFKVSNALTDEGVLEVFGINGQLIYSGRCILENGTFQISANAINVHIPGTYVVRFTNASGSHVLKFNKL